MLPRIPLLIAALLCIALVPLAVVPVLGSAVAVDQLGWLLGVMAVGMTLPLVKDLALTNTTALPDGADTVNSAGIDLGLSTQATWSSGKMELLIEAPALAVADLGDAATMKYSVYHDTAVAFGSETLLAADVLVQTGAGGAGAAAATARVALPSNVKRYIRVKATNSAAGDASDKSMVCSLVF